MPHSDHFYICFQVCVGSLVTVTVMQQPSTFMVAYVTPPHTATPDVLGVPMGLKLTADRRRWWMVGPDTLFEWYYLVYLLHD